MASAERRPPPTLDELLGRDKKPSPPAGGDMSAAGEAASVAAAAHTQRSAERADGRKLALVDGSNVAHFGADRARLRNVLCVRDKLVEEGYEPIIVADAALRHQIDDADGYERLVQSGSVQQAPAGTDADYFILSFARELDASIVSNDQFRDRSRQFSEVRKRVVRFMIVQGEVVFERRTHKRKER